MLALERRNLILEKLQEEKRVVVSELSQLYNVSEETIRRDLDKLESEGYAIKSYGGAVRSDHAGRQHHSRVYCENDQRKEKAYRDHEFY